MNIEEAYNTIKKSVGAINTRPYATKAEYEKVECIKVLLTAYEKEKGLEEKIKKYINIIQKELDKYKIKNTNTYLQIEGNPEISELLIQRATLEELIKEE
jgi:antitoxin component HigA of HigAB toxin-antitoxin module